MTSRENADPSVVLVHGAYADGSPALRAIRGKPLTQYLVT
jgi:hypothetical protein